MSCLARSVRGCASVATLACLLLGASLASATSLVAGTTSMQVSHAFVAQDAGVLRAALSASTVPPTPQLEIFFEQGWLHIQAGAAGDPVSDLRYVLRETEQGLVLSFDLSAYFDWGRHSGEIRFHGVATESGSSPLPEPAGALLFGAGLLLVGRRPLLVGRRPPRG